MNLRGSLDQDFLILRPHFRKEISDLYLAMHSCFIRTFMSSLLTCLLHHNDSFVTNLAGFVKNYFLSRNVSQILSQVREIRKPLPKRTRSTEWTKRTAILEPKPSCESQISFCLCYGCEISGKSM